MWTILMRQVSNSLTLVSAPPGGPPLRWNRSSPEQVLVITMVLSFAIDDHIEGGVIAAVILLNIVVG
jgi:hypothetical protein